MKPLEKALEEAGWRRFWVHPVYPSHQVSHKEIEANEGLLPEAFMAALDAKLDLIKEYGRKMAEGD